MKVDYSLIRGRIEEMESTLYEQDQETNSLNDMANKIVPILSALSGNGGMAVGSLAVNSLYEPKLTREKNKLIIEINGQKKEYFSGTFKTRIKVNGIFLNGWLTGICFKEGDMVNVVTDGAQGLVAIANPEDRAIVMPRTCYRGLGACLKESAYFGGWGLLFFGGCSVLMMLGFYFFGDLEAQKLPSLLGLFFLSSLLVSAFVGLGVNFGELRPARKAWRIFSVLGLERPSMVNLARTIGAKESRERVGGEGVFYFY